MSLLREFAFDLPDNAQQRRQFALETRCITSFFERKFPKFYTPKCWKILVECVAEVTKPNIMDLTGVFAVQVGMNETQFFAAADGDKKSLTLDLLMRGINRVLDSTKWDATPFVQTAQLIRNASFRNEWVWKQALCSPNRKYRGKVFCRHEIRAFEIQLVIENISGVVVARSPIITELPDEWAYSDRLGRLTWANSSELMLLNKQGGKEMSVST